jgi:hypothetical protein
MRTGPSVVYGAAAKCGKFRSVQYNGSGRLNTAARQVVERQTFPALLLVGKPFAQRWSEPIGSEIDG